MGERVVTETAAAAGGAREELDEVIEEFGSVTKQSTNCVQQIKEEHKV